MIPNQPYVQQTAAMPEYYQQNLASPNQANISKPVESEKAGAAKAHCHVCMDMSHMHDFHYLHDFHHMHAYPYMMHDFHPMAHYHPMYDFHPAMYESWDPHMHVDHYHPHMHVDAHDEWESTSIDYHHESFQHFVHPHYMHHMYHPVCYPVVCYPADKGQQSQPDYKGNSAIHTP
jgi:hypothetical protein